MASEVTIQASYKETYETAKNYIKSAQSIDDLEKHHIYDIIKGWSNTNLVFENKDKWLEELKLLLKEKEEMINGKSPNNSEDTEKEKVPTQDVQDILSKFDCYDRKSGKLYVNEELKKSLKEDEINKWKFEEDSDIGNSDEATNLIDIDKYWNFYGVEAPKVDVEFLVGSSIVDNEVVKNWININYDSNTRNSNHNNYFVSANIVDKGFKELELVLYDRTFVSIQRLISASINFVDESINETNKEADNIISAKGKNYFSESVKNGPNIEFFVCPEKISSNLRIRYGYNDDRNTKVKKTYSGISSTKADATGIDGTNRWKWSEQAMKTDEDTGTSIRDDVVLKDQFQQSTLFSSWDEFYITGLTSTLTETGIKYTIKAVSVDEFSLSGYKMVQQYSKIVGKPKTVMATLMNMFNSNNNAPIKLVWADDEVKSTDSSINGTSVLMNYKTGKYEEVTEETIDDPDNGLRKKLKDQIDGLSKNIKLLKDILACFEKIQENNLNEYSNGQSVYYGSNIGIILDNGLVAYANIPEKRSYLDFVAWPFNINDKLVRLNISNDYKSNIIKMAKFQKSLANNYGILMNILKNKEEGFDSKSSILTCDILKIWLANIAIEAYNINDETKGRIGELGTNVVADKEASEKLKAKVTQIKEYYKVYNNLPIRWAYNSFYEDVSSTSTEPNYYYYPGRYYIGNDLQYDVLCTSCGFEDANTFENVRKLDDLDVDTITNNYLVEPNYIKNAADKSGIVLDSLIEYASLYFYSGIDLFAGEKTVKEIIDKEEIKLKTNFYSNEISENKTGIGSAYYYNNIPSLNTECPTKEYLKKSEDLLKRFVKLNEDFKSLSNYRHGNDNIIFYNSNDEKEPIYKLNKKPSGEMYYSVNGFDITSKLTDDNFNDIYNYSIETTGKGKKSHYVITIRDKINNSYFKFNYDYSLPVITGEELKYTIIRFIRDAIQLSLDLLNKSSTILGVKFISQSFIEERQNILKNGKKDIVKSILEEYKEALLKTKKSLQNSIFGLDNLISTKNKSISKSNLSEDEIEEFKFLYRILEEEINNLDSSGVLSKVILSEEGTPVEVCSNNIKSQNYGISTDKMSPDIWKSNYLLDAYTLVCNPKTSMDDIGKFSNFLKGEINKETEELKKIKNKLTKVDSSNIGKEIELSLGSQESKNENIKITKTLSSLLNDFCSQCQPKETLNLELKNNSEMSVRDGNGDSKKVNAYDDTPKYNLTWGIVGHYVDDSVPIIGLYYRKPKDLKKVRMYNWGTGNPKAHCIKSLSIANSNEFAMMHNFNVSTNGSTGLSATINSNGGSLEIKDFMPSKEPCFFSASNDSDRESNLLNNTLNSVAKGTITLLGDPSLKFYGSIQPYTYPIYINIKLQQEVSWSDIDNKYNKSGSLVSQLSGYYVVTQITHNISNSGYTTTLEIMKYPGSNDSIKFKSTSGDVSNAVVI